MEDELSERCIEGSAIFLIWAGRPIMMNSVLGGYVYVGLLLLEARSLYI